MAELVYGTGAQVILGKLHSVLNVPLGRIIIASLYFMPIVDSVNGLLSRTEVESGLSLAFLYRVFLITICSFSLLGIYSNLKNIALPILLCLSVLLPHVMDYFTGDIDLVTATVKVLLPILLIETLTGEASVGGLGLVHVVKLLKFWSVCFPLTIVIPFSLGLGYATYEQSNTGYKAYYIAQNDLCYVLVTLYLVCLLFGIRTRSITFLVSGLMNGVCLLLLGLKGGYILLIVTTVYVITSERKSLNRKTLFSMISVGTLVGVLGLSSEHFHSIVRRWLYFVNSGQNFIGFFTSSRFERVDIVYQNLFDDYHGLFWVWFGSGSHYAKYILPYKIVEFDPVDLFFRYGAISFVMFIIYYLRFIFLPQAPSDKWVRIAILVSLTMACLAGHVLTSAMSVTVLAIVCLYCRVRSASSGG